MTWPAWPSGGGNLRKLLEARGLINSYALKMHHNCTVTNHPVLLLRPCPLVGALLEHPGVTRSIAWPGQAPQRFLPSAANPGIALARIETVV